MKIWLVTWVTESGDKGVDGYWTEKPSSAKLSQFLQDKYPDDYSDEEQDSYLFPTLHSLESLN